MAPHMEIYKCPVCDNNVTKSHRSIGCACCNKYFHIKCTEVSLEQFNLMLKNKVFKYICDNCLATPKVCNIQEELENGFSALKASLEKELEMKIQESQRMTMKKLKVESS
ncbi:hypothetical protein CVS40_12786 [Lucilia cuprina]|nr:hypothetical protein CVS40_12786 [Lucilia cuprina]